MISTTFALQLIDKIFCSINASKRSRHMRGKFSKKCFCLFVLMQVDLLTHKVPLPVEYVDLIFIKSVSLSEIFALVITIYRMQKIPRPPKVRYLDETGITSTGMWVLRNEHVQLQRLILVLSFHMLDINMKNFISVLFVVHMSIVRNSRNSHYSLVLEW